MKSVYVHAFEMSCRLAMSDNYITLTFDLVIMRFLL